MKKIISYLIIISIFLLPFFIKNTTFGYEISNEKEKIISKYFNKDIENTILNIVWKWDKEKQFNVYNKIKKIVLNKQIEILDSKIPDNEKEKKINKLNAFLFVIEKSLSDDFKPQNNPWDSI